ncbi:MAG: hypothetical protein RL154_1173, partial [Pseudomonadota bacterium]
MFILIGSVGFFIALYHAQKISETLANERSVEQVEIYKTKINSTVEYDIKVFLRIAKSTAIIDFIQKEQNEQYKKIAFELLNDALGVTKA